MSWQQTLFEQLDEAILVLDDNHYIQHQNQAAQELLKISGPDLRYSLDELMPQLAPVLTNGGKTTVTVYTVYNRPLRLDVQTIVQPGGGHILILRDVTTLTLIFEEQQRTASRLTTLIYNLQAGILVEDDLRRLVVINQKFLDLFAIPVQPQDLINADCEQLAQVAKTAFSKPKAFIDRIDTLLKTRKIVTGERLKMADGRIFERDYIPVFVDDSYQGNLWQYRDVTQQEAANAELRRSERRFRALFEQNNDAVFLLDLNGKHLDVNQRAADMLGYDRDELRTNTAAQLQSKARSGKAQRSRCASHAAKPFPRRSRYTTLMRQAAFLLLTFTLVLGVLPTTAQQNPPPPGDTVALAYVLADEVWLADSAGNSLISTGLVLDPRQAATLFWSPDGDRLYVATRDGLFVMTANGSAPTQLPGTFGLTVAFSRDGEVLYNLDAQNPQIAAVPEGTLPQDAPIAFPLRETNLANLQGGRGRLVGIIGAYDPNATQLTVTHAAALYARDNGILEIGRPRLFTTYGDSLFYSCCFPGPGLGLINVASGEIDPDYDLLLLPGAASLNDARSRLAGQLTDGRIRTIDLISAGVRDYEFNVPDGGLVEQIAWALDDSALFLAIRQAANAPLAVMESATYPADARSANVEIWRLDLATSNWTRLFDFGDVFGVSSLAATDDFLFAVVVDRNQALVEAVNRSDIPPDVDPMDPVLDDYQPTTALWRIPFAEEDNPFQLMENAWGAVARPN